MQAQQEWLHLAAHATQLKGMSPLKTQVEVCNLGVMVLDQLICMLQAVKARILHVRGSNQKQSSPSSSV